MTSPRHEETEDFAFAEGRRLGLSWTLRAASADQVRELLVGSTDPLHLATWDTGADLIHHDEADQFRSGFVDAVGEVLTHLRRFRQNAETWAYADIQPDAVGVVLRLRPLIDTPMPAGAHTSDEVLTVK